MNFIKRLFPNSFKLEVKYFLMRLLKMPYNRLGISSEIINWLPNDRNITFVDVGASIGMFSLVLTKQYKIDHGILIEPLENHIPLLKERFADPLKYSIFNLAISESAGETEFFTFDNFDYVSSLLELKRELLELPGFESKEQISVKVKTDKLDNIVSQCPIKQIDLLKIDVQGAEHIVLLSGIETLKKTRLVYLEFSYKPMYEGSSTFFDLYKIMTDNNFRLVNVTPGYASTNGELLQGDALFVNNVIF
jgi:FkbM family methyltransferase